MGITNNNARFLVHSLGSSGKLGETITIGHQHNYVDQATRDRLSKNKASPSNEEYIDRFLKECLGATSVSSLDYSAYQGCDIVHDLNRPLGEEWHGRFDTVIDGGSIEHIFNVPEALANYMRLAKVGGQLFVFSMANNHAGHGLYQLAPDFFYAALQPKYGFRIKEMILEEHRYPAAELGEGRRFYRVAGRDSVQGRIAFTSQRPVMIMVHAEKTGEFSGFSPWPIQPSYEEEYGTDGQSVPEETAIQPSPRRIIGRVLRGSLQTLEGVLPSSWCLAWRGARLNRSYRLKPSKMFQPVDLP